MGSSAFFDFRVSGIDAAGAKISVLQSKQKTWRALLNELAVDFTYIEAAAFTSQGVTSANPIAPEGAPPGPWADNTRSVKEWKGHDRVLRGRTEALVDSLTSPEAVVQHMTNLRVTLGTAVEYAHWHQRPEGFTAWGAGKHKQDVKHTRVRRPTFTPEVEAAQLREAGLELQERFQRLIASATTKAEKDELIKEFKARLAEAKRKIHKRGFTIQASGGHIDFSHRQHIAPRPPVRITAKDRQRWVELMRIQAKKKIAESGL